MKLSKQVGPASIVLLLLASSTARAGMPVVTLTDVARMRAQTISFFLAGFFLSALLIQFLWNRLRLDFSALPRLTNGKALVVVTLWGLLFVLVLTMISGARELMTPGAWERNGRTYKLVEPPAPLQPVVQPESSDTARREKLEALRRALWEYADMHQGRFPTDRSDILSDKWTSADPSGMRFVYVVGRKAGENATPLAYEPAVYGDHRLVLFTNGDIRTVDWKTDGERLVEKR
jgi:hypothetical protein